MAIWRALLTFIEPWQAVELLRYPMGWNFALNRQVGDPLFHPSSRVNFRNRMVEHGQSMLGFTTILAGLEEAGWVSRQSRQRLDSTPMFGRVSRMSRLDCVRESLRLALQELEGATQREQRPVFWIGLWERYVESQAADLGQGEQLTGMVVDLEEIHHNDPRRFLWPLPEGKVNLNNYHHRHPHPEIGHNQFHLLKECYRL